MSWDMIKWKRLRDALGHALELTRSRPYHTNDQSRVEQKNYTHIRLLLGYERMGYQQLLESIHSLFQPWSLWNNLYNPTLKQASCHREGSKRIRTHEPLEKHLLNEL